MKLAVTVTSPFMVTLQVVPDTDVQPELQPPKECPVIGVGVRETEEPLENGAVQVVPQCMRDGALTIEPFAAPAVTSTERLNVTVP